MTGGGTNVGSAAAAYATVQRWLREGRGELPTPGSGNTWERWHRLLELAREDLPAARLLEAHEDAMAILAELDDESRTGPGQVDAAELWAVWAAEPPEPRVRATHTEEGWLLDGTKAWCSGATQATHALITADAPPDNTPRLFAVDLRHPGAEPEAPQWAAAGMSATDTGRVTFHGVPARAIGNPTAYLERAGFWHGGIGVACCWWGGARGLIDLLAERVRKRRTEIGEAHLGACLAWDTVITAALRATADDIDAAPRDFAAAQRRAFAMRTIVDRACTDVIERFGRALGAAPYASDPVAAQRLADVQVYVRQCHAEFDEAALARIVLDEADEIGSGTATDGADGTHRADALGRGIGAS